MLLSLVFKNSKVLTGWIRHGMDGTNTLQINSYLIMHHPATATMI